METYSILHLSDLHRDLTNEVENSALLESISRDISHFSDSPIEIPRPALCIVSGDLVYGVNLGAVNADDELKRQYEQSEDFLIRIADELFEGNREHVVILPGNHDICANTFHHSCVRIEIPPEADQRKALVDELFKPRSNLRWSWKDLSFYRIEDRDRYLRRLAAFSDTYRRFYQGRREYSLAPDAQYDFFEFSSLNLVIVTLNSCYENDPFHRAGAIHPTCISNASRRIRTVRYAGQLVAAAWHHSLFGGPMQDDYLDADVLQALIDSGVSLGFHGHQHRSTFADQFFRVGQQNRKITVFSASTLCAGPSQLTPGEPRGYNVIEIDPDTWKGRVHQRRMMNSDFTLPIWGPGVFVESGKSYLEFELCPPTGHLQANLDCKLLLETAETAVRQRRWLDAIHLLRDLRADPFARVLLTAALENTDDFESTIELLWPPQSVKEAVAVGGAILATGSRDQSVSFVALPFVATHEDPSLREIVRRIRERKLQ